MSRILTQITREETDMVTGEITRTSETTAVRFAEEPPYIKIYLQDLMYLSDLPVNYSNVVYQLAKRATYASEDEGMVVTLSSYTKKQIAKTVDIKLATLDNILTKLVKGKILYRLGTGTYRLNPYLFGKGSWSEISKIRLDINYDDIKGRTFGAVIKYKEKDVYEEVEAPEY